MDKAIISQATKLWVTKSILKSTIPQDLTQAAKDIKALLDQLSTDYPTDNDTLIGAKAIMKVEGDPTLKQRLINAIQEGGAATIEELTQHPAIKIVLAALKGAADA